MFYVQFYMDEFEFRELYIQSQIDDTERREAAISKVIKDLMKVNRSTMLHTCRQTHRRINMFFLSYFSRFVFDSIRYSLFKC